MNDIALLTQTACIWEATARKAGNVHRFADFKDTSYLDFLLSAAAIAPVMARAPGVRLGATILEAVRATRRISATNTNLGIILLLAPLAAVADGRDLALGVSQALRAADVQDSRLVYEAIRLAAPGGLGKSDEQDVAREPTLPLCEVMRLAMDRDSIAREYACDYALAFEHGLPALREGLDRLGTLEGAIIWCHLRLLSQIGDTLIARKCGQETALQAREMAGEVIAAGWPASPAGRASFGRLDGWLRADGSARNPGTTADLVAASLFAALRTGTISLPLTIPWSAGEIHA